MSANKMTVLYDYRANVKGKTRSKKDTTLELGPWLDVISNQRKLYNTRCFYIVKANADPDTIKYGIGGLSGKSGSFGRLRQYVLSHGYATDLNPCKGVRLLYLAATIYNPIVETVNTAVYRKELQAKTFFRSDAIEGRGFERILQERLDDLFKILDSKSNKSWEDIETERRTSERLKEAEVLPSDKVIKIISHETKGGKSQAKTKFLVQWSRPYKLTEKKKVNGKIETIEKEVDTTYEPYSKLISYLDGSKAFEVYSILHPGTQFRT